MKSLWSNPDAPCQYIPKSLLTNVGGLDLFKCNYDINKLNLSKHLPSFYRMIIAYWQYLIADIPRNRNDVLEQIIWNNKFITLEKKSIYYPQWRQVGILKIKDLFDTQQNCFPPFDAFINKFKVKCNYLQYYGLVSSIPRSWKKLLHTDCEQCSTPQINSHYNRRNDLQKNLC